MSAAASSSSSNNNNNNRRRVWKEFPHFRDTQGGGWKHLVALGYAAVANGVALAMLMIMHHDYYYYSWNIIISSILLAAHGRIIASYLVHECAHSTIFVEPYANHCMGVICLYLAGCPYADFVHVKVMHHHHHKDRADPYEWDFQSLFTIPYGIGPMIKYIVVACEWACIPAVETIMHLRTALYPILSKTTKTCTTSRKQNAWIGTILQCCFYSILLYHGGLAALLAHLWAGVLVLHFLALHDAFQHTYQSYPLEDYKPGPNGRTAQYEEDNTYSNLLSDEWEFLNLLSLNFGYHNAHHKKAMTPWYSLRSFHHTLYNNNNNSTKTPQLVPMRELMYSWWTYRVQRVLSHDYGKVHPPDTPNRTHDFVGAAAVNFLTV